MSWLLLAVSLPAVVCGGLVFYTSASVHFVGRQGSWVSWMFMVVSAWMVIGGLWLIGKALVGWGLL